MRWNVLFVEPCSPGYAPVASVCQPTPVFGGKAGFRPFSPLTPFWIKLCIVGMAPSAANLSTRSGRMPSEANRITLSALGLSFGFGAAPDDPAATAMTAVSPAASTSTGPSRRNRLFMLKNPPSV